MPEIKFETLGEVAIWAQAMRESFDEIKKTMRLMVLGCFGTCAATLLEIVLKANHLI
jgi:hypothetical protein